MTVLQVCAYGAQNPGNFIASLTLLEQELAGRGVETIYAFVERARDKAWCREIQKRTKVYFLPEAHARVLPETYRRMQQIYRENQIDITHSHFELYDIPATVTAPKGAKVFWHLHDPIQETRLTRKALWKLQYGFVGRRATLLSVADYYREAVIQLGFPAKQAVTVLNGIDLERIHRCTDGEKPYDFMTMGWDFYRKGDDLILAACDRLAEEGYRFKLLLNGNEYTWPKLDEYLDGRDPEYLVRGNPVTDINEILAKTRVFIQASRRETFSYAVCEAAYAGLPVISSDIAGLEWAHDLPTVSFFEQDNSDSLYRQMKRCLDGRVASEEDIDRTGELIREKYSAAVWAKQILQQYGMN